MTYRLVSVGSSWGGLAALKVLLSGLPGSFPLPVVVAQHRSADSRDERLASYYRELCDLPVRTVEDKQPIEPGVIYFAPSDYHLLVEKDAFALSTDERVQFSRPSIDVLLESAADSLGEAVIGVILTGANADGARGIAAIEQAGGFTIVQEPSSAARPEMPSAALGSLDRPGAVLPLEGIAPYLSRLVGIAA